MSEACSEPGEPATCIALIVAGGRGTRAGGDAPKQYLPLAGEPVIRRTLRAFLSHPRVHAVGCVIHPDDRDLYERATEGLALLDPVAGGPTRQDSVRNGLESLVQLDPATVLVHDAARPLVTPEIVDRVLSELGRADGAVAAVPIQDSVKRALGGRIAETVDRTGLWRAQTPQGFRFRPILEAYRQAAGAAMTDDAAVAERAGLAVVLVPGSEDNIKITGPEDLGRVERILSRSMVTRVGLGFDVHRFGPGDRVVIGGLSIPHDRGLTGHSDADVALHALTDALLGAIGAEDIGSHFPPGDPRWRGADSAIFLRHAVDLVLSRGAAVEHLDLTIICESPRIGPHRAAMLARISEIAGIPQDRLSVKATTTEGLGFTGRGEGIAAQAVATVRVPSRP